MKTEIKPMPLQREWEKGGKLCEKGGKLCEEGWELWEEGEKLWDEGMKLKEKGDKLWDEGEKLWADAIIKYYGEDAKVKWRTWNKDNEPTCHVNGDVYA